MSGEHLVELQSVRKRFVTRHFFHREDHESKRVLYKKRETFAADDISFAIRPGEIFGLLGPNGAGKTTTVKMVSGLVKPDAGLVFVDGLEVERHRRRILQKVGVVLEGTRTSIWPLTPVENLMYYGNLKNVRGRLLKGRAHELLDFIGLKEKKHIQVRRLSRGEKQKLAICIALIADPNVILLDEPTTGLDVQSARAIKDKVLEMTRTLGKCVLVTTHDMHVAQELCHRIGIIDHGKLVANKPTVELLDVFSDQMFVFRVDQRPPEDAFTGIPGVMGAEIEMSEDGPAVILRVSPDAAERSEALYAIVETLRGLGLRLRAIDQRQQNLEHVFLQLTSSTVGTAGAAEPRADARETSEVAP